jgi:hypothetical protein
MRDVAVYGQRKMMMMMTMNLFWFFCFVLFKLPCRDRVTRQHYYYQLRENVLRHGQPATEESFFRLAALALQAELGDYDPERHRAAYFDTQLYFPQWVNKKKAKKKMMKMLFFFLPSRVRKSKILVAYTKKKSRK